MNQKIAEKFMRLAIKQAIKGKGETIPNPLVGCVIAKDGKVVSAGYHKEFGGAHAEIIALKKAGRKAEGAVMFVTLEPCAYHGKTPPCTKAIVEAGIKQLVCAGKDPHPLNNGRGLLALQSAGVKVKSGILKYQAEQINPDFIERMKQGMPFVTLKLAQSIDGKIATKKHDSKWISSSRSRSLVQGLRKRHDAIMVGINTVLCDDPMLTIRRGSSGKAASTRQPIKIIVDSGLKISPKAVVLDKLRSPGKVIIACAHNAAISKERALRAKGADIIRMPASKKGINLKRLMHRLLELGVNSILLEGGGEIAASMLEENAVDNVYFFISPIIIGGRDAVSSIAGQGVDKIDKAIRLGDIDITRTDKDILVKAYVYRNN